MGVSLTSALPMRIIDAGSPMRRYALLVLFLLILLIPFVMRWAIGASSPSRPRDAVRVVIVTPHVESIKREFADAFDEWHREKYGQPAIVDYRNYGGATDIRKFFETSRGVFEKTGTFKIDLVWGGGDYLFDVELKRAGVLEGVQLPPDVLRAAFPKPDLNGLPLYDTSNPPAWFGTALSSFGIVFNKDVLRILHLPEPKTWSDLRDPKYHGWVVLADPTRSAAANAAFMVIVERAMADASQQGRSEDVGWAEGMGLLRQIASNARIFTDATSSIPGVVSSGDVAAGMTIDFHARAQIDAVGESRLGYVEPIGATSINPDPIALVRGAEHRDVAVRFIEFILSERGQRLWNTRAGAPGGPKLSSLRRLPIMQSVYDSPVNFTDKVNPYAVAAGFNTDRGRTRTFSFLADLIEMSCIDLLEQLKRCDQSKLTPFPFDEREALRRGEMWKKVNPLERLELKRNWTDEFRIEIRGTGASPVQ